MDATTALRSTTGYTTVLTSSLTTQWRKDPFTLTLASAVKAALTSGPHWRSPCGGLAVDSRVAQVACTWFYTWQDAVARLQSAGPAAQLLPVTFAFFIFAFILCIFDYLADGRAEAPARAVPKPAQRGVLAVPMHHKVCLAATPLARCTVAGAGQGVPQERRTIRLAPAREREQRDQQRYRPNVRCECSSGTGKSDRTCVAALGGAGSSRTRLPALPESVPTLHKQTKGLRRESRALPALTVESSPRPATSSSTQAVLLPVCRYELFSCPYMRCASSSRWTRYVAQCVVDEGGRPGDNC
jgi:hypothetical protein